MNGLYGSGQFDALAELDRLWHTNGKRRAGQPGQRWKHVLLTLAVVALPLILLAGGFGS